MFKNLIKKGSTKSQDQSVLIACLLIHAAKMDQQYTEVEKNIIKKALQSFLGEPTGKLEEILIIAEKKEAESNQIVEFTKEIKKNDIKFRMRIIEILWKIIYSDGNADMYETSLMRRINGLLYVSDFEAGKIKQKIIKESKK